MPRLTMEALMAPGGLLDAGSRLTQTLVETPFRREQFRAGIREKELERAEGKALRQEAFRREDERTAKGGRLEFLKSKVGAAEKKEAQLREAMLAKEETRLRAMMKTGGAKPEDADVVIDLLKASFAKEGDLEQFSKDPAGVGKRHTLKVKGAVDEAKRLGLLTPQQAASIVMSDAFQADDNTGQSLHLAVAESTKAWEDWAKEAGVARDTVKAQKFIDTMLPTVEADAIPAAPVQSQSERDLGFPGMEALGAEAFGTQAYRKDAAPKTMDDVLEEEVAAAGAQPVPPMLAQDREDDLIMAAQSAAQNPAMSAQIRDVNKELSANFAVTDRPFELPKGVPGGPAYEANRAARTAAAQVPLLTTDPRQASWGAFLKDFGASVGVAPEQFKAFEQEAAAAGLQGGLLQGYRAMADQRIAEEQNRRAADGGPEAIGLTGAGELSADEKAAVFNQVLKEGKLLKRLQDAAFRAQRTPVLLNQGR